MLRIRPLAGAIALTLGIALASAGPAAADLIVLLKNYHVGGTLTVAKLGQTVTLPSGARFNGQADLTTKTLIGHVAIPEFTVPISVLGIPTTATLKLVEAKPVTGTFSTSSSGALTVRSKTASTLHIVSVGLSFITIPAGCETQSPLALTLNGTGILANGIAFNGSTTIPQLTGCGLFGPTLSLLLSGPNNGYHITLSPPPK